MFYIDCDNEYFYKAKLTGSLIHKDNGFFKSNDMNFKLKVVDSFDGSFDILSVNELFDMAFKYKITFANCYFNCPLRCIFIKSDYDSPNEFYMNTIFLFNAARLRSIGGSKFSRTRSVLGSSNYYIYFPSEFQYTECPSLYYNGKKIGEYHGWFFTGNGVVANTSDSIVSKVLCMDKSCNELYITETDFRDSIPRYYIMKYDNGQLVKEVDVDSSSYGIIEGLKKLR